jgi:tellurite resistance protein
VETFNNIARTIMKLITPSPEVAHAALGALKSVALVDGAAHELEQRFFDSVQEHILGTSLDFVSLEPIAPSELAKRVTDPEIRERVLSACIVMALIDSDLDPAEGALLEEIAHALELSSYALRDVQRMLNKSFLLARIDVARRSFLGQRGRAYFAEHGVVGVARTARALLGIENKSLAARYQALEHNPRGTLGREYFEFVRQNGFALPGEKGGAPEVVVFHDCLHVLGGYQTSSIEETQIASFQAGMLEKDPIFGLLFMLAQFHIGVQITPITAAEKGVAAPELMMAAFVRGTQVNRDMCVDWIPQHDFDRTLTELRAAYNINPREQLVAA